MRTKQLFKVTAMVSLMIASFSCGKSTEEPVQETCKTCHAFIGSEEVATQQACSSSAENSFAAAHPGAEISCY